VGALAAEAGRPLEAARPCLQVVAHRSCLGLSVCPELTQQGHLVEREGERERFGGGAVEGRAWWDKRPGAGGTARFPGRAKPSCWLSQSRK
jgi:hypothetical protein